MQLSLIRLHPFFIEKLNAKKVEPGYALAEGYKSDGFLGSDEEWASDSDIEDPQKLYKLYLQKKEEENKDNVIELNYEELMQELDMCLPKIPEEPKNDPVNPPPYDVKRIKFGSLVPKEPPPDEKKKAQKKPAPRRNPKDPKPKPIRWGGMPGPDAPTTLNLVRNITKQMAENVFPAHMRGNQSNPGLTPCVIKEVLYPPKAPSEITTLIESAFVYQNTANFDMALGTLLKARDDWRKDLNTKQLRPEIELFFELSIGSVYESSGRDEHALSQYIKSRHIKLEYNHPDLAFSYCGIGSVLFHMNEPSWSLRAYLKAREIREDRLGGDTVDTATVYNNLGACMYCLERNQEALAYFELAGAILETHLGPDHERTRTASRNILKAKRTSLNVTPEFQPLWHFPVIDPFPKKTKGKKKKKKKS